MDTRKSDRLRKKPAVNYQPQNNHNNRNKRLKRSPPEQQSDDEVEVLLGVVKHPPSSITNKYDMIVDKKRPAIISPRYHNIFYDLFGMMRYTKPYQQFVSYLEKNRVTNDDLQQLLKIRDKKHGYNLIHQALSSYTIGSNSIDYKLIKLFLQVNNKNPTLSSSSSSSQRAVSTAATKALLAPTKDQGLTPLHIACCNIQKLVPKKIKILLDADETKSSWLHQSKNGVLPLHCLCSGITVDGLKETIQLLLSYDKNKLSLLIKNKLGQTPIDKVAHEVDCVVTSTTTSNNASNNNATKLSWLFPLLAEERVKVVPGPALWRNRLRIMLSSNNHNQKSSTPSKTNQQRSTSNNNNLTENDDDSETATEDDDDDDDDESVESIVEGVRSRKTRQEQKESFQKLVEEFQNRANEYDQVYKGMLWLELAIWKGDGLSSLSSKEERKKRWLTCGSTTIVKLVSQYF